MATGASGLRHFEDVSVGETFTYGAYPVTKAEIFEYAHAYDPQPHHIDEEAAMRSLTKGLCASGWHSCAMFMRLHFDGWLNQYASLGGAGIDEVRWLKPVRPGHILQGRTLIVDKRASQSRPEIGIVRVKHEMRNQHDEALLTMELSQLIRVRGAAPAKPVAKSKPGVVAAPTASSTTGQSESARNYFEDLVIGTRRELGSHTFTAAEIKMFAGKYDPQAFHLDEEAAKTSIMGALCASGWHTAAHYIGANIRSRQQNEAKITGRGEAMAVWGPSPGFKDLKWPKPVFAGDTVTYSQTISGKVDLKSRPERGLLQHLGEGRNQHGEIVFQVTGQILVPRRVPLQIAAG
ncbi:MAG: MaoC family dehydratase [Hyphomicrobiaceae bacterium]